MDHRLANSLQLAANFLLLQQLRMEDAAARDALVEAANRLAAMGQLHRFLSGGPSQADVDLRPFLIDLGRRLDETLGLRCAIEADAVAVPMATAQQLAMAVNELAMNAVKHAYGGRDQGALHIEARRRGAALTLSVTDLGAGLPEGFDPTRSHGLGMSILLAIVRQLGGVLRHERDDGSRFTITSPLPDGISTPSRSFAPQRARCA